MQDAERARPRSITLAAAVLATFGLLTIETTRRSMFELMTRISPPGPLDKPTILVVLFAGIVLFWLMLAIAVVGGISLVTAGRLLHGVPSSQREAFGLLTANLAVQLAAAVTGTMRGFPGPLALATIATAMAGGAGLALILGRQWLEPSPHDEALIPVQD